MIIRTTAINTGIIFFMPVLLSIVPIIPNYFRIVIMIFCERTNFLF